MSETMTAEYREARKALTCLYIAVESEIAADVERKCLAAIEAATRAEQERCFIVALTCPIEGTDLEKLPDNNVGYAYGRGQSDATQAIAAAIAATGGDG